MIISLAIFYYLYLVFLAGFLIFAFFHLYHIVKFGVMSFGTVVLALIFIAVSGTLVFLSLASLQTIDWSETIEFLSTTNNNYF